MYEVSTLSIAVRILLALVLGGILGLERGRRNQPAGFRTYMLVCLGATIVMLTGQYVFQTYRVGDPSRMAAQVVSGIGFLGAGSIIVTARNQVKGLTTAAGLWTAASIGIAIGIGFYEGAILASIAVFLVMTVLQRIEHLVRENSRHLTLYVECESLRDITTVIEAVRKDAMQLLDIQVNKAPTGSQDGVTAIVYLKNSIKENHVDVVGRLSAVNGVRYIEKL